MNEKATQDYEVTINLLRGEHVTAEELGKLHIMNLRVVGRALTINNNAGIKKEELIEDIMMMVRGERQPQEVSSRGRPAVEGTTLGDVLDMIRRIVSQRKDEESVFNKSYERAERKPKLAEAKPQSTEQFVYREGVLDVHPDGYGFLRGLSLEQKRGDVYVPRELIRSMRLKKGDYVYGKAGIRTDNSESLFYIEKINGRDSGDKTMRHDFDDFEPVYPTKRIELGKSGDLALRAIDLVSPVGFGQRGIIVSPPKAGKTTILKKIACSIEHSYPNVKLFVLLIGERPEEVTDFKHSTSATVVASTFDSSPERHARIAEFLLLHAKRRAETGEDVVILLDSLTRLARANNNVVESSGKSMTGGLDTNALQMPKMVFGAARDLTGAGSLTIIATCLTETNSRMDEVIFEEFKGTGNMELYLSRENQELRIFPALDLQKSGTRHEEYLLSKDELHVMNNVRRMLFSKKGSEGTKLFLDMLEKSKDNDDFVKRFPEWAKLGGFN